MTAYAELGSALRAARQKAGRTVSDMASETGLPERYVQALEEGNVSALPDLSYARLYLQSYARAVQLDPEWIQKLWPAPQKPVPASASTAPPRVAWRRALWGVAAVLVLATLVAVSLWKSPSLRPPAVASTGDAEPESTVTPEAPGGGAPAVSAASDSTSPQAPREDGPDSSVIADSQATLQGSPAQNEQAGVPGATTPAGTASPGAADGVSGRDNGTTAGQQGQATPADSAMPAATVPVWPFSDSMPVDPAVPRQPMTLTVTVAEDTWTVIEADGDTVEFGIFSAGEPRSAQAQSEFLLTVTNTRGLLVQLDGDTLTLETRLDHPLIRRLITGKDSP